MYLGRRNYMGETWKGQAQRRIMALEVHIKDLERRLGEMRQDLNVLNPAPPRPPEGDDDTTLAPENAPRDDQFGSSALPDEN